MLRNKNYVYGDGKCVLPFHLHLGRLLLERIVTEGDRCALINTDTGKTYTYAEVAQRAVDISLSVAHHGFGKGHVIGIMSEKRFDFLPTFLGVICAGATHTQVDIESGPALIKHRFNSSNPSAIICSKYAYNKHKEALLSIASIKTFIIYDDEALVKEEQNSIADKSVKFFNFDDFVSEHAPVEDFIPVDVSDDDLSVILYSSGTTGLPKPIPWTHKSMIFNVQSIFSSFHRGKRGLLTREWYNSYGLSTALGYLYNGGTILYTALCQEDDYFKIIEKYKANVITTSPVDLGSWSKSLTLDQYDLSSLEMIICGSTPLSATIEKAINDKLPTLKGVCQLYGMSEAGGPCRSDGAYKGAKVGSVGTANSCLIIKVVDVETRRPLGPNQRGEICIKGPVVFRGYMGRDNTGIFDDEGFYLTGDLGYYDEDKYFYVVERIKELLKCNSYAVAPAELEAVLLSYEGVVAAGVVGKPFDEHSQIPVAFVQLQEGSKVTAAELQDFSDKELTKYRISGGIHIIDSMPMNAGKVNRRALRDML